MISKSPKLRLMNRLSEKVTIVRTRADTAARPDEYGLTQTKGDGCTRTVMGLRKDLRWPRKLHDNRTLRAGMLGLGGCLKKTIDLVIFIIQKC